MIKKHIIVGLSGGVDSSVAAFLLKEAGHHVEGLFMKNWEADEDDMNCPAGLDLIDAQSVCDHLNIELHQVNFAEDYWHHVFTHFLKESLAGRTPNPDILCNKEIKFKAFLNLAKQRGADFIATGHYVRSLQQNNQFYLLKGNDPKKDQSYFLHCLAQNQLANCIFPIGDMTKTAVRQLAKKIGLLNHAKKDSTGICFVGERRFKSFLSNFLQPNPGPIETLDGKVIGQHDGLMFYTLGQRQGLNIGGLKNFLEAPWYVVSKNIKTNTLVVSQGKDNPALFTQSLIADQVHWITEKPQEHSQIFAKVRYRQADQACMIQSITNHQFKVDFAVPQRAVTPGQSVVFYQENRCLGGGIII